MARRSFSAPDAPQVKPLRYRIDPTAEQSDILDGLLAELEKERDKISPDDYADMVAILKGRQHALDKRVSKLADAHRVREIDCTYDIPKPDKLAHLLLDIQRAQGLAVTVFQWLRAFLNSLKFI